MVKINQHQQFSEFVQPAGIQSALFPVSSLAKAAKELLNSKDSDTRYEVGPLQDALALAMGKPLVDARDLFQKWLLSTKHNPQWFDFGTIKVQPPLVSAHVFRCDGNGNYQRESVRRVWGVFLAALSLMHPDLYGDVINGDEAQLAEIARLRAALIKETQRADTAHIEG
jgi:hypothetical protein